MIYSDVEAIIEFSGALCILQSKIHVGFFKNFSVLKFLLCSCVVLLISSEHFYYYYFEFSAR